LPELLPQFSSANPTIVKQSHPLYESRLIQKQKEKLMGGNDKKSDFDVGKYVKISVDLQNMIN